MIICESCDFQNLNDDSFCGSCGGFLEWTGKKVEAVVPKPAAETDAPKRSLLSKVQTALSLDIYTPPAEEEEEEEEEEDSAATPEAAGAGAAPPRSAAPPKPGGTPPARSAAPPKPGGTPPARPGAPPKPGGAPPAGPSAPPSRPPPPRPGGAPPARSATPPSRPPPPKPGGAPPPRTTPAGGPGATSTASPTPPSSTPQASEPDMQAPSPPDASALVADGATSTPSAPSTPAEAPRSVARKTVPAGERTLGQHPKSESAARSLGATNPVKPQAAVIPATPQKQKSTRKILAGDLICGGCGEGNPPSRKFCSRCGTTLTEAEVAKKSWWRRFVPSRRRKSLVAGDRPWSTADGKKKRTGGKAKLLKIFGKLRPIIAGVLLLSTLVYGVSPDLRGNVNDRIGSVKDAVMSRVRPTFVPISPIDVTATSELEDFTVRNAVDSNTLTTWIAPGTDPKPAMVVRFDEAIDLKRVKIWNGAAVGFKDNERIAKIHLVFDTGSSFDLEVTDLPDGQDYEIGSANGVREVELFIVETHASLGSDNVGLSEIEFLIQR